MRLGRQTPPLQAHFLLPSARAINPTPLFVHAACTHRCSNTAQCYLSQFDTHARKRKHISEAELSNAVRRNLIFLQELQW
jgi:hypothetical protein